MKGRGIPDVSMGVREFGLHEAFTFQVSLSFPVLRKGAGRYDYVI